MENNGIKSVFIPGHVPSSKNSKVATQSGVFHSKTVGRYLREMGVLAYSVTKGTVTGYKTRPSLYPIKELTELCKNIQYPAKIGLHFVRKNKAQFDFHNISQIVFDMLVAHKIIEDDSMAYVLPFPVEVDGKWYSVDKNNPGVYVYIL
jgi:hypothetical protein